MVNDKPSFPESCEKNRPRARTIFRAGKSIRCTICSLKPHFPIQQAQIKPFCKIFRHSKTPPPVWQNSQACHFFQTLILFLQSATFFCLSFLHSLAHIENSRGHSLVCIRYQLLLCRKLKVVCRHSLLKTCL